MNATLLRALCQGRLLCFLLILFGCSEPEDSEHVSYCKVAVDRVAFNPSDMKFIKIEEDILPTGGTVDIQFDDFNKYGAKQRRRISCDFDSIGLMTEIWVDHEPLIPELVRNINLEAFIRRVQKATEKVRSMQ